MPIAPSRRALRRILKIAFFAAFALYAAHPLALTAVAQAFAERQWTGEADIGAVYMTPAGTLVATRVSLRYPREGRRERFLKARDVRVRMSLSGLLSLAPRLRIADISCKTLHLVWRKEAYAFLAPRENSPNQPASFPFPAQRIHLSCDRGTVEVDPPAGLRIADGSAKGLFTLDPHRRTMALALDVAHPQWSGGRALCEANLGGDSATWRFSADRLKTDESLKGMLPAELAARWDLIKPQGAAKLDMTLTARRGSLPLVEGTIQALEGSLCLPPPCPLELSGVSGAFLWGPGGQEIQNLAGSFRGTPLAISGRFDAATAKYHLTVNADGASLTDDLRGHLPPRLQQAWDFLRPQGVIDLEVSTSGRTGGNFERTSVFFKASLQDAGFSALTPQVQNLAGDLEMELFGAKESLHGEGIAHLTAARVGSFPFNHLTIPIFLGMDQGVRTVDLGLADLPFEAGCAGGTVQGRVRFTSAPAPSLEIYASGHDIQIGSLAKQAFGTTREISGRLEYRLRLKKGPEGLSGSASFKIKDGDLGRIPTLTGVLEKLLGSDKVDEERIRRVEGKIEIHPNKIVLTELKIHGKNIALYASDGTIRYGGEIDVTLFAGARKDFLQDMIILGKVWEFLTGVVAGIASVRVTGTVREPHYEMALLRGSVQSIANILEDLLKGGDAGE